MGFLSRPRDHFPPLPPRASMEPEPSSPHTAHIALLPASVVNRIAAGEVVQRPSSVAKELLENSLDANATTIDITLKQGGLALLSIRDDGHGVRSSDLPLLCTRHATSKLLSYEALERGEVGTFGFRGEALASASHVAHVSIVTRHAADANTLTEAGVDMAYTTAYRDGEMEAAPRSIPWPHEHATGTTINVENIFYNTPQRRAAMRSHAEEASRVLQVCMAYASGRPGVGISVRKEGAASFDLHTTPDLTARAAIRRVYGGDVADCLLDVRCVTEVSAADHAATATQPSSVMPEGGNDDDDAMQFRADGFITSSEYRGKRSNFVLFVNDRLVESAALKRAVESVHASTCGLQGKHSKPFCLLKLTLPPEHVDVNVSPTKREVAFLHHNAIAMRVASAVEEAMLQSNARRLYEPRQATLPFAPIQPPAPVPALAAGGNTRSSKGAKDAGGTEENDSPLAARLKTPTTTRRDKAGGDHKLVRVDARMAPGALEKYTVRLDAGDSGRSSALVTAARDAPKRRRTEGGAHDVLGLADGSGGNVEGAAAEDAAHLPEKMGGGEAKDASVDPPALGTAPSRVCMVSPPKEASSTGPRSLAWMQAGFPVELRAMCARANAISLGNAGSTILRQIMREHVFVGMVDNVRAAVQHETKLYVMHLPTWVGDFVSRKVSLAVVASPDGGAPYTALDALVVDAPQPHVSQMLKSALELEASDDGGLEAAAHIALGVLMANRSTLGDCYQLHIDDHGTLTHVPMPIEGMPLDARRIPGFLLAVSRIDFTDAPHAHEGIASLVAALYAFPPVNVGAAETAENGIDGSDTSSDVRDASPSQHRIWSSRNWVRHTLMEDMRWNHVDPPRSRLQDGSLLKLTSLEQLYRVFER